MKHVVTLFLILLSLPNYGQWVHQATFNYMLNDVTALDENTAIVIGENGTIIKTTDGGENWFPKVSGTDETLNRIQFGDENTGFCIGDNGLLLKTIDGGENWVSMPSDFNFLSGISCVDEMTLYVLDDNNLQKSADGGLNFSMVGDAQYLAGIQFINHSVGFGTNGNTAKKTTDGGVTWTNLPISVFSYEDFFARMHFANETVGFAMSGNDLYRTSDAGETFTYLTSFSNLHIFNLYSTSSDVVWTAAIPMLDFSDCYTSRVALEDNSVQSLSSGLCLKSIHFSEPTNGFAVDWSGNIFRNTTGTLLKADEFDEKNLFIVYPNPASESLNIRFAENNLQDCMVVLCDISGRILYSKSFPAGIFPSINTDGFAKGSYIVSVMSNGRKNTKKVVLN